MVSSFCCEVRPLRRDSRGKSWVEGALRSLLREFQLNQECTKWVLDVGLSAPSHPLIQLLDSEEGEKTREMIKSRVLLEGDDEM